MKTKNKAKQSKAKQGSQLIIAKLFIPISNILSKISKNRGIGN